MSKELAKFEDWPFRVPSLSKFEKKVEEILSELKDAKDVKEALAAYRKMSKLTDIG